VHALGRVSGKSLEWEGGILGDINDTGDVALHRGAGKEKVDLIIGITESTEVLDTTWIGSAIEK
jgi:hypothetical protein